MSQALLAMMCTGTNTISADDVFSAYTRTGTGADATVTTNIDMTQGYMLWSKGRSGATDHAIYDSARGVTYDLVSNSTAGQTTQTTGLKSVSSTGHTVGSLAKMNTNSATYVDWVFRKSAGFFDVVTFTTDNTNLTFNHSLGVAPGLIIIKQTDGVSGWYVYHRSLGTSNSLTLNTTDAATATPVLTSVTSSQVTINSGFYNNNKQHIAYIFAHDTGAAGLIQCGSFTTDGSGNATVNLGWEPQYILSKSSSGVSYWQTQNSMCGFVATGGASTRLFPNTSWAEEVNGFNVTSTGFKTVAGAINNSEAYIYMAIRRPNKPPTVGTQVYNAIARTGTGGVATVTGVGFAPDLAISKGKDASLLTWDWQDRLRGATKFIKSNDTAAENTDVNGLTAFGMDGVVLGTDGSIGQWNYSGEPYGEWFFKRAVGVFDIVCYTGDGSTRAVSHNLGVAPELMIFKSRSNAVNWVVYDPLHLSAGFDILNSAAPYESNTGIFDSTAPTSTTFKVANYSTVNQSTFTYVAYLFATKSGISKVGSYTGNGTTNAIDCGFTTGARFVMIKRTDSTGDWYVWDTVRGIVAGNDPYLLINSTAAEVTSTDYIDPSTAGFELSSTAPAAINANGGSFVFLAFA